MAWGSFSGFRDDVELTRHPHKAEKAWPAVTYRGDLVLNEIYKHEGALWGHIAAREEDRNLDAQECYLGYLPELDQFVMGWDAWRYWGDVGESDNGWAYVRFAMGRGTRYASPVDVVYEFDDNLFYHKGGGYDQLHKQFPGIVDLRLD